MKKNIIVIIILVIMALVIGLYLRNRNQLPEGVNEGSIIVDGLTRNYLYHIPDNKDNLPLVIALHGGLGSGKRMIDLTENGFTELSDKEEFIIVYPDGIETHWNDGRAIQEYKTQRENIDDVKFISKLIDKFINDFHADPQRVYVTGISNGGFMSYRLACELSDKIAAIAPVAGEIPKNIVSSCRPSRAIPVLAINGKNDPLVLWEGGHLQLKDQFLGDTLSAEKSVEHFASLNGCSLNSTVTDLPNVDVSDGTTIKKIEYSNCDLGKEVTLYEIEGGGHTWPGGWQYLPESVVGKTSRDIDANKVIWDFFKEHG